MNYSELNKKEYAELNKKPDLARTTSVIAKYALSRSTLDRAVNAGHLTRYKRNRASFFDMNQVDAWLMGTTESE